MLRVAAPCSQSPAVAERPVVSGRGTLAALNQNSTVRFAQGPATEFRSEPFGTISAELPSNDNAPSPWADGIREVAPGLTPLVSGISPVETGSIAVAMVASG